MKTKVTALVEKNEDNYYSIVTESPIAGCYFGGYGFSVEEAKTDFMESIPESFEVAKEQGMTVPEIADLEIEFRYDIPSFFNKFDWINVTAFAKMIGINESKLRLYKTGEAKASEKTTNKIMAAVRKIGAEFSAAML